MNARVPRPNLRRARLRLGWSKERAADEISRRYPHLAIDARQIGRWESGETALPRPMNVLALSRTYGRPPEELDLPPIPGADLTSDIPGLTVPGERQPGSPTPKPRDRRVVVQALATDGDFVTLVVNRRELVEALDDSLPAGVLRTEDDVSLLTEPLTAAEGSALTECIGRSIEAAWALSHTSDAERMLAVARTQVRLLRWHHGDLDRDILPTFYSAAYRLLGATQHRLARYEEALQAHGKAYLAALESGNALSMAQSRAWEAYGLQSLGRFADSLPIFDAALRLISEGGEAENTRLRARLQASAAISAATLRDRERADAMLSASEALVEKLPPLHEEFDRVAWLEAAGVCCLCFGRLDQAISQLKQALSETPQEWLYRQALATIALARALAYKRSRDSALAAAYTLMPRLKALRSRELMDQYILFLREDLLRNFPGDRRCRALVDEAVNTVVVDA